VVAVVNGRDRNGMGIVKLGLGAGIGFALYMLISGSGGFGFGRGADAGPAAPPRPRDEKPIEVRVKPSPTDPQKAVIELEGQIVTANDLIARIIAGGRRDVLITVRGDTIQGAWDEIRGALAAAQIEVSLRQLPTGSTAPAGRNR